MVQAMFDYYIFTPHFDTFVDDILLSTCHPFISGVRILRW